MKIQIRILRMPDGGGMGNAMGTGIANMATGAMGSFINGAIDLGYQQQHDNSALGLNKNFAEFQREQAMRMWRDTGIVAQIDQIKKAGMNPALMYKQGGGMGQTAQAPAGGNISGGGINTRSNGMGLSVADMMQAELMKAQADNLNADTKNKLSQNPNITLEGDRIKADTGNIQADTKLKEINATLAEIQAENAKDTQSYNQGIVEKTFMKLNQEVRILQSMADVSGATVNEKIEQIRAEAINEVLKGAAIRSGIEVNEAQIKKMAADIEQRGYELEIKEFEAMMRANFPTLGEMAGGMLNSIKGQIDKAMGIGEGYKRPNRPIHKK